MRFALSAVFAVVMWAGVAGAVSRETVPGSADRPRLGTYRILSYGAVGRPPLPLGSFTLADGTYKAFLNGGKAQGEGRYSFDAAKQVVTWESGPYKDVWGGEFTTERDGKTHKIRLKRTTIATNSID